MAQTLSHEIVHSVKVWNKEGYTQLQKYVMEAMGEDQFDTLLAEKLTGDDYSAAYDEVIADSCEMLLRDSKALEKIARENASLFVKIKEAVQSFIDKLKKALKEAYGDTGELHSAAEALKLSLSDMTEIQQLFDDVLYKSISNMKNALAEAENAKTRENLKVLENAAEKENIQLSEEKKEKYDFKKPFAEQVDDYKNGKFPKNDTLIVSGTPKVWRDIGFNSLPVTINQTHVGYALNGTKDFDHHIGEAILKNLPNALQSPIAIIQSQSKGHSDRAVVIFDFKHNGSQVISAIEVDGIGLTNNNVIDSNAITTLFAKGNALSQLKDAIVHTNNGAAELFYWDKKKSRVATTGQRAPIAQFPASRRLC